MTPNAALDLPFPSPVNTSTSPRPASRPVARSRRTFACRSRIRSLCPLAADVASDLVSSDLVSSGLASSGSVPSCFISSFAITALPRRSTGRLQGPSSPRFQTIVPTTLRPGERTARESALIGYAAFSRLRPEKRNSAPPRSGNPSAASSRA